VRLISREARNLLRVQCRGVLARVLVPWMLRPPRQREPETHQEIRHGRIQHALIDAAEPGRDGARQQHVIAPAHPGECTIAGVAWSAGVTVAVVVAVFVIILIVLDVWEQRR
jgi:hypothetical protein